jgi:riboflavin transporter FmnP
MIKKEVFIGFIVGLLANAIGFIIAILIFGSGETIVTAYRQSLAQGFFSKLVSMGALLNLVVFFMFIKQRRDYRARGVIMATIVVTIATFLLNYN